MQKTTSRYSIARKKTYSVKQEHVMITQRTKHDFIYADCVKKNLLKEKENYEHNT
jgi:hypothetical protein